MWFLMQFTAFLTARTFDLPIGLLVLSVVFGTLWDWGCFDVKYTSRDIIGHLLIFRITVVSHCWTSMGDNFCIYSLFSRCLPSFRRSCSNDCDFLALGVVHCSVHLCPARMPWPWRMSSQRAHVSLPSKFHSLSPWEFKWHTSSCSAQSIF